MEIHLGNKTEGLQTSVSSFHQRILIHFTLILPLACFYRYCHQPTPPKKKNQNDIWFKAETEWLKLYVLGFLISKQFSIYFIVPFSKWTCTNIVNSCKTSNTKYSCFSYRKSIIKVSIYVTRNITKTINAQNVKSISFTYSQPDWSL